MVFVSRPTGLLETPFDHAYPRGIETEWIDVMGYGVPLWISDPESEYRAFREAVGLLEYSMLYRWEIRGPRAVEIAHRVHSRNITVMKPGEIAYGVVVDDDGLMLDDPTVSVYGSDHVLLVGGTPALGDIITREADSQTTVTERRTDFCVLSVQGPLSRELLQTLTDEDLSNSAFPYYTFKPQVRLAGCTVQMNRIGFTAELGFEVVAPIADAPVLMAAIREAGGPLGALPCGAAALMMCRIESGMVMAEVEYDRTLTPFECRLGWAVDFDKGEFNGRDSLLSKRDSASGRVMTIRIDGDPDDLDGAAIEFDGRVVGQVTMAVPSPALDGATLAMARLHRDVAQVGHALNVTTESGSRGAEVLKTPVYDPERIRVRS